MRAGGRAAARARTGALSMLVLALAAMPLAARAATSDAQRLGISVSGGPRPVTVVPGDVVTTGFTVRNPTAYTQPVSIRITGLSASGGSYTFDGTPSPGLTVRAKPASFSLAPHGARDVLVTVAAARGIDPGGAYAGLIVRSDPTPPPGGSAVAEEIALPLIGTVPGVASDAGRIVSFGPERSRYDAPPFTFLLAFRNTGRVHYPLRGDVTLSSGGTSLGSVPLTTGPVLPATTKNVRITWTKAVPAGELQVRLRVRWGISGEHSATRTASLVVGAIPGGPSATPAPGRGGAGGATKTSIVWPAVAGGLAVAAAIFLFFVWKRRRRDEDEEEPAEVVPIEGATSRRLRPRRSNGGNRRASG